MILEAISFNLYAAGLVHVGGSRIGKGEGKGEKEGSGERGGMERVREGEGEEGEREGDWKGRPIFH